jgi:hypothetical protein
MLHGDCAFGERAFEGFFEGASATLFGTGLIHVERQFRIYTSTQEYVTLSSDSLATQPFNGTLLQPLQINRSLLGSDIIGQFTAGSGKIILTNADGEYDFLIERFAIDGRDIEVRIGREGDSYDSFYTVFKGTASDWSVEEDVVEVDIVDNAYKLSVAAQENAYGGTGGADGTSDLVGKRKPKCYGYVYNISPPLVVPASLIYQVHDGSVQAISAVYDRGVTLTAGTDYATYALLAAASISAGQYGTCKAQGYIKLGSSPSGTVTADVQGDNTGGFIFKTADIVRRVLTASVLDDPDDLYVPSFTAVNLANASEVGYYISPDDTTTVADVVAHLMRGVGGWGGFRRSGRFELGIFLTPTGAIPAAHFDKNDIFEMKRERLPSSMTPPPWRFRVGWQHNWTTQTDLAGSVSATRKSFLSEADRYAEASADSIKTDHPFAQDRDPIISYFRDQADAQTEADRLLDLYRSTKALYRFTVGIQPFALDLGDVVNVTYPRWDLTVGRNLRIVEMSENAQSNTIELVGYG